MAYLQKAVTLGSFSSSYPRDQDHFLLDHVIVKGESFVGNNFTFGFMVTKKFYCSKEFNYF